MRNMMRQYKKGHQCPPIEVVPAMTSSPSSSPSSISSGMTSLCSLSSLRQRKRKVKLWITLSFIATSLILTHTFGNFLSSGNSLSGSVHAETAHLSSRHLLSSGDQTSNNNNNNSQSAAQTSQEEEEAKLPWEACALEKESKFTYLWLFLWALIVFWLFIALAIICDDFFVPSLEEISDRLNLTEDVAGATFMAAGSSAPELFTSLSGVFVKSDVGIGTIVGSAIFNLLIIIALSAALAGKVLNIDWRPLSRDALFYSLSIVCFIVFCWDGEITVYEAAGLFSLYIVYVTLMFFNPHLMNYMNLISCCCTKVVPQQTAAAAEDNASKSDDQDRKFKHTAQLNGLIRKMSVASSTSQSVKYKPTVAPLAIEEVSEVFEEEQGDMLHPDDLPDGHAAPGNVGGNGYIFVDGNPVDMSGKEDLSGSASALPGAGGGGSGAGSEIVFAGGSLNNWYYAATPSTNRHRTDSVNCSQGTRKSSSTSQAATISLSGAPNNQVNPESGGANSPSPAGGNTGSDQHQMQGGENNNLEDQEGEDEEDEEITVLDCMPGVPMAIPQKLDTGFVATMKYAGAWILFVLAFPWALIFAWTVPNCGKPHLKKYYLASFLLSLFWIGVCSFAMVLLVGRTGCALDIQQFVMGLVIVAVGTSVPDALSSVIVARDGYGDMAVSNAIGSNVFDIDLGLGLPFLVRMLFIDKLEPIQLLSAAEKEAQKRHNNPLIPHVKFGFILFFILLLCYLVFIAVRFRLNKFVGITFVIMYVIFIMYAIIQEFACDEGFAC